MSDSNIRSVQLTWDSSLRFTGGAPGGPEITVDADGETAPGPMAMLLIAAGGCTGADVVSILRKMQVDLRRCDISVTGERATDHPRRYLTMHYRFLLEGGGLDEAKARRAIDLSIEKYCSVRHTLNPDIPVTYEVEVVAGR